MDEGKNPRANTVWLIIYGKVETFWVLIKKRSSLQIFSEVVDFYSKDLSDI